MLQDQYSEVTELVILPEEFSVGTITVYHPGDVEPSASVEGRGTIRIPRGSNVFLNIGQDVSNDLRRLCSIPAVLLRNGISFVERNLAKADFRRISPLQPERLTICLCSGLR